MKWHQLNINKACLGKVYGKTRMVKIPSTSIYFYHPAKLIRETSIFNMFIFSYTDEFYFTCFNSYTNEEFKLSADEMSKRYFVPWMKKRDKEALLFGKIESIMIAEDASSPLAVFDLLRSRTKREGFESKKIKELICEVFDESEIEDLYQFYLDSEKVA